MPSRGVALPPQHTGSSLFHEVLTAAIAQFPELKRADLPAQAGAWKRNYGSLLARFEAVRVSSPQRGEIARFIVERAQDALQFVSGSASMPLVDHFSQATASPSLQSQQLGAAPVFQVDVPFEGKRYRGREALELIERLSESGDLTLAARAALRWTVEHIEAQGGTLDLRGQRFVLLGAGAELAPTASLLAAGAQVLWVDVADASAFLAAQTPRAGTLVQASEPLNLLENPAAIRAAIERFAADGGGPVHLGAFAYASGSSREWRLGAAMNAIVTALAPEALSSLSMLVSPTTVPTLQPESLGFAERQLAREPVWKSTLSRTGLLPKPGHYASNGARIGLSTVSIQGLSYQAAQYISKLCAAETFALYGSAWQRGISKPLTVSANVAGITRTRSMSHPLFAAAFLGAPRFGVRIFAPESTRALSLLLMLHDLLNPAAQSGGASNGHGNGNGHTDLQHKAAQLHARQIHGGLYNLPYVLEPAIRMAALIGMGMNPSVLLRRRPQSTASAAPV